MHACRKDTEIDPNNTGKYQVEAALDIDTINLLLEVVGGEIVVANFRRDWAGFGKNAGETITPTLICLVSNNQSHLVINLIDVLSSHQQNPTILIADKLDYVEATEIVHLLQ